MEKQYHMGTGNNVGIYSRFMGDDKVEDLIYSNDLMDYFNKNQARLKLAYLRSKYNEEFVKAVSSPEFEKWANNPKYLDEYGDPIGYPPAEHLEAILSCMGDEYRELVDEYFEKIKKSVKPIINSIQRVYDNASFKSRQHALIIKDGKAVLDGQFLIHSFPMSKNIQDYEARRDLGIIASEYFGKKENMGEGAFCAFFTKYDGVQPRPVKDTPQSKKPSLNLIFDASDPAVHELLNNDYFEYVKNKDNNDYISKLTKEQLDMFKFIESKSPGSDTATRLHPDWVAIPGGIPPQFIVGIKVDGVLDGENKILAEKAAQYFNVPLINSNLEVVYVPKTKSQLLNEDNAMFKEYDQKQKNSKEDQLSGRKAISKVSQVKKADIDVEEQTDSVLSQKP